MYATYAIMSPMNTMIISGIVAAIAAVTTLVSGTFFKRAFDSYDHARRSTAINELPKLDQSAATPPPSTTPAGEDHGSAPPPKVDQDGERVRVGAVKSVDQKGGVTAGYVGSVNQTPPEH